MKDIRNVVYIAVKPQFNTQHETLKDISGIFPGLEILI